MEKYLIKHFEIYSYHTNYHQKAKIRALFGFFQETASLHAKQLGVGFQALKENHNVFWALSRFTLKMYKYPKWEESINCKTWPKGANRIFAHRDFEFLDQEGNILGAGASDWITISAENRSIVNPQEIIKDVPLIPDKHAIDGGTKKVKPVVDTKNITKKAFAYSDLDMNQHVNSISYLDWAIDSLPLNFLMKHEVEEMSINFMHEITAKETIVLYFSQNENNNMEYTFTGENENSKLIHFNLKLKFRKIED